MIVGYKTVSNELVGAAYNYLINQGIDKTQIYKGTGIKKESAFKEKGRINYSDYLKFLDFSRHYGTPFWGQRVFQLSLNQAMKPFGELFALCLNCTTAKEALALYFSYRAVIGESDFIVLKQEGSKASIHYINEVVTSHSSIEACANFVIIYQLLQFYNQNEQIRCDACFLGEAWLDRAEYHDFFKGTIRFNEPVNRIEFDISLLAGSTSVCNPFLSPYLEAQLMGELQQIHAQKNCASTQLYHRVREHISTVAREEGFESLNVDTVCRQLNMSRWTLRRKLGEEGISYKGLIEELRQQEAAKQLSDMSLMIGDISDRLGFSSQGAFSRFFSLHFGMTPSEYRFAGSDWQAQR